MAGKNRKVPQGQNLNSITKQMRFLNSSLDKKSYPGTPLNSMHDLTVFSKPEVRFCSGCWGAGDQDRESPWSLKAAGEDRRSVRHQRPDGEY